MCSVGDGAAASLSFPLYGTKHRASWFQCPFKETKRRGASAPQTQGPSAQHLADVLNENLTHQKEARQCSEEPVEEDTFFLFLSLKQDVSPKKVNVQFLREE